jgi:hypothetical protein
MNVHMNSRQVFTFSFLARVALPMCVFGFVATAHAQTPEAPVILEFGSAGCVPSAEICGDGVDQNCDGSDLLCPGSDPDADGYGTGADCDNSNKKVYPGVAVACTASCGSGTALCQANGSYSACSCSPLCEAKGSGRCYYVSKLTGNDSNSGTFSQPLRSALRFSGDGNNPSTRIQLQAGDVVYFMSGQYDEWVQYGDDRIGLILINARGTSAAPIVLKAYPGANPVFAPSVQAIGIRLFQTDHVTLEGLEVTRAYQGGIQVSEADNSELKNLRVYDIDGVDNDNIAGIMIHTSDGVVVHHSMIHDNYDRTNADTGGEKTGNSRNVVLFGGGNIRFHHNSIFQTPATTADKTGACVSYKHRMTIPNAVFEVDHNMFWNCFDAAVITSTYNGKFHHNLIVDSDRSIDVRSHGGPDVLSNNVIEYNTIVNTPGPYFYSD